MTLTELATEPESDLIALMKSKRSLTPEQVEANELRHHRRLDPEMAASFDTGSMHRIEVVR